MKWYKDNIVYSDKTGKALIVETEKQWKLIMWEGACYAPCWVLDDIWVSSEWLETAGTEEAGYNYEPMHDKECRYSQVKVVESGDARVVVHWRYALNDTRYRIFHGNSMVDEYYYVYPEGYSFRKVKLSLGHKNSYGGSPKFWEVGEVIPINPKGVPPMEYIDEHAATYMNIRGDRFDQKWSRAETKFPSELKANSLCKLYPPVRKWNEYIIRAHFIDRPSHFLIFSKKQDLFTYAPCNVCKIQGLDDTAHPHLSVRSSCPAWSHWPGYEKLYYKGHIDATSDHIRERATHTSVVSVNVWEGRPKQVKEAWYPPPDAAWLFLTGGTTSPDSYLIDLTSSWLYPGQVKMMKSHYLFYDFSQGAYVFEFIPPGCEFILKPKELIKYPVFMLKGWPKGINPVIKINNRVVRKERYRITFTSKYLVLWFNFMSRKELTVQITQGEAVK